LANFHILAKLNSHHTICRYQFTTVGRVGNRYEWQGVQTENQGGQTKKNFRRALRRILSNKCLPTLACRRPWSKVRPGQC